MIAQTTVTHPEWINVITTLATTGGMAAMAWYFVVILIPRMTEAHHAERSELLALLAKERAEAEARYDRLAEQLRAHKHGD